MDYGIFSDKINYPGDQEYNFGLYYLTYKTGIGAAIPLVHNGTNILHCVYDSRNIYKRSTVLSQSSDIDNRYYGDNMNIVIAGTAYYGSDTLRNYLRNPYDSETRREYNRKYTENIFYNNDSYGLAIKDEGNNNKRTYTSKNRPLQIIDHFWLGSYGSDIPKFNYKFNYVKKIGVVLPSFHYPDISEWHRDDRAFLYTISGNEFKSSLNGYTPGLKQVNRKYELYDECIANGNFSISDVLVVDLSDLPI